MRRVATGLSQVISGAFQTRQCNPLASLYGAQNVILNFQVGASTLHTPCPRSIHTSTALQAEDYYNVLGVSKSATDQEIKKSFYKLAKQYHPDTNQDNPDAAKKFQEVQKAYETLRDPEKRRLYDQVGREGIENMESGMGADAGEDPFAAFRQRGGPGGFPMGDLNSILEQLLGQAGAGSFGFGLGGFGRGSTVQMQANPISISFMESVHGCQRRVDLGRGLGGMMPIGSTVVNINIPPGVDTGDQVPVTQEVSVGRRGNMKLMILFPIMVESHPYFTRKGNDLYVKQDVGLTDAVLGCTAQVPTLEGTAQLKVPQGTAHGDKLAIRGKGIYNSSTGRKGDLYVEVHLTMPKNLTDRQKQLLQDFQEEEKRKTKKGGFWS